MPRCYLALSFKSVLLAQDTDVLAAFERDFLNSQASPAQRLNILQEIDPTRRPSHRPTLLEEKCQTVMRLLKSDLANLPVANPAANPAAHFGGGAEGPPGNNAQT